jgi:Ser/Thr protein kinase RdoA (MazF antagonist)
LNQELQAALFFLPENALAGIVPLDAGNINDTYTIILRSGERRILQRLNQEVFSDPRAVMHNMRTVLDHLHNEMEKKPAGTEHFQVLSLFRGKSGDWFQSDDGSAWRMISLVGESTTCSSIDFRQSRELGRGLGFFHRLLHSLDPAKLVDTLPDIHNTRKYLHLYNKILSRNGRADTPEEKYCGEFIDRNRQQFLLPESIEKKLTHGVIHGDPKVDNFLFDTEKQRVISLIDLDTVKPGLLLEDIGDALRSSCNAAGETPVQAERVIFDADLFQAWIKGYFSQVDHILTASDHGHIVHFTRLIAFELGLRFYSDYLDGNRYFKVGFPEQNLQRAITQFHLVRSIEKQWNLLQSLVRKEVGIHKLKFRYRENN